MELAFGSLDVDEFVGESAGRDRHAFGELPDYTPKQDTVGWFHAYVGNHAAVDDVMRERHGPNHLKSAVEHDYYCGRFTRVIERGCAYIAYIDAHRGTGESKMTNTREMLEIVCRAAMRTKNTDLVRKCADSLTMQECSEPGIQLTIGKANFYVERYDDAINAYLRYLRMRPQDYSAWKCIGACLAKLAERSAATQPAAATTRQCETALACYVHAMSIAQKSVWTRAAYAHARYEREMQEMQATIATLKALEQDSIARAQIEPVDLPQQPCSDGVLAAVETELQNGRSSGAAIVEEEKSTRDL
ncbi:hypothetical protein THASP1DRAFT_31006 [Thamnocephalis sphaerospora]|uniref:ER membrane protein complex subunit 2 n=1 Tax=Thamnocephalis sphaerospora TaxID=78915 RepID=A0A4P9XMN1_9FUNG|nr:hypothetical protein THASP1DRAFT_31006 [Thamnocephalis sphaerospora]|eukprot:RKP07174.1 hypothetical protein THASP1DRAFT_31006 [Thamnocephalis sphaerospora]